MMFRIGELGGYMAGLRDDSLADCAVTFAEKMQSYGVREEGSPVEVALDPPFVHACARNHATDALRTIARQARRIVSLDDLEDTTDPASRTADSAEDPEKELLGKELVDRILDTLNGLNVRHRDLLVRHHVQGEPIESIAQSLQLTYQAVEQRLYRARQTLRSRLIKAGIVDTAPTPRSKP